MGNELEQLIVTKATGEENTFSGKKFDASLQRAGATDEQIAEVRRQLMPMLYDGIPTKKIYKFAYSILKKISRKTAAKYSLKQGIMKLGPTGFPFEKFVSELLRAQGYATKIGVFVEGRCIRHEIDVVAEKDGQTYMVECKYHNLHHNKSSVKVTLYIHARFNDVATHRIEGQSTETRFHQSWLVTNTRFTQDAIRYASCVNLRLIGWDFPRKEGLKDMVDSFALYPITCLTTLSNSEKQNLLDMKVVLCKELLHNETSLRAAGMQESKTRRVLDEVERLCSG